MKVRLVSLGPATLVNVLVPIVLLEIVKVTVAPGATSVTVIPFSGRPPVFVT